MKITDVKTYIVGNEWKNWVFTHVETDEGITGLGEATLNGFAKTVEMAIHELKRFVIGEDPFDVEKLSLRMFRDYFTDGGQIQGAAISGIDYALWDVMGKKLNLPVYKLLGGKCHDNLRAYANGWYQSSRTPEGFYNDAKEVVDAGYTALKFDPFGTAWRVVERKEFNYALEIIEAVRDAVGNDADILIEGHNRFSVHTALQFAQEMKQFNPTWFEAPVPPQKVSSMVEIAKRSPVPIACGEDYHSREQFAELMSHDAVHIIQLEPQYMGITAAKQVAGMAHAHNAVIAPHSAQGPLCSIVCGHLNTASPNFYLHEIFDDFNKDWTQEILTNNVEVMDGHIQFPDGPGWGTELNVDLVEEHPYSQNHFLPLFREGWEKREGLK
ncbi:mandelate racemase/muconate lactonizing enzyme family protein [Lentibacillus salicampi]|uniref:Mandelate racemase/muconate lactonizing enzyme family protein n=1 Tax=Lentibacillus salicampi TaxID=175306 RepID=A0A4Y9A9E6_9BACI|nr:mandelate racemase/muconate lactonizing enzyme family protein [Lentibacillus salicampi]TFJ92095.1 mandelate racemase/muconate lactonizing enzyme family protein [Lentibacillus salicampi]